MGSQSTTLWMKQSGAHTGKHQCGREKPDVGHEAYGAGENHADEDPQSHYVAPAEPVGEVAENRLAQVGDQHREHHQKPQLPVVQAEHRAHDIPQWRHAVTQPVTDAMA